MKNFRTNYFSYINRKVNRDIKFAGFTIIEILCTASIFLIIAAGILKINNTFHARDKFIRTRTEMSKIGTLLEDYKGMHGDYPRIVAHNDEQGNILCSALHGKTDYGNISIPSGSQIDLVDVKLNEINNKFVDQFLSDYIYYYKLVNDDGVWENSSYILISKGVKGQQNPSRNLTISKGVTVLTNGSVSGSSQGDIILTNSGFL